MSKAKLLNGIEDDALVPAIEDENIDEKKPEEGTTAEDLDNQEEGGETPMTDDEIEAALLAIMEYDKVSKEDNDAFLEMDNTLDEAEGAVERLCSILDVITKYGVSTPVMIAADPQRELVAKGICPAYEELDNLPEKDEVTDTTIEGISDTIKAAFANVTAFFSKMSLKIKDWTISQRRAISSYEFLISRLQRDLKNNSVNEEKFQTMSVKALSKKEYMTLQHDVEEFLTIIHKVGIENLLKLILNYLKGNELDHEKVSEMIKDSMKPLLELSTKKDMLDHLGITMKVGNDIVDHISPKKSNIVDKRDDVKNLDWKISDFDKIVADVEALTNKLEFIWITNFHIAEASMNFINIIHTKVAYLSADDNQEGEMATINKMFKQCDNIFSISMALNWNLVNSIKTLFSTITQLMKEAQRCIEK